MNELDKKLYELFSDKTLSEGCKIQIKWEYIFTCIEVIEDTIQMYHPLKLTKTGRRAIQEMQKNALD